MLKFLFRLLLRVTLGLVGAVVLLVLALGLRISLLPMPYAVFFGTWQPASSTVDAGRVVRTEYYRGFFRPGRTLDASQSRAILAVLQDSMNFRGDTTPDFTQRLVYYDAQGRVLGYTDLDVFDDNWLVTYMAPGGFRRGGIMRDPGRRQVLRLLGFAPPFTEANLRRQ